MDNQEGKEKIESLKEYQLISFKLGKEDYAIDISQVREVVLASGITPVPLVSNYVKGLANIRGNIITVINLAKKLSIDSEDSSNDIYTEKEFVLVVENKDIKFGIWLNEMPNTLKVTEEKVDFSTDVIQNKFSNKNYLRGIIKLNTEKIVILIDIIELMLDNKA